MLFACSQPAGTPEKHQGETPESVSGAPVFQLSTTPPPDPADEGANWCNARFGDQLVINAEQVNTNRRYFFPGPGITKLVVGPSGATATLLLEPTGDGNLSLYTGANFPECLSQPANISPAGGASILRYNNYKNVDFRMELQEESGHLKVILELPPGARYGVSAQQCPECQ